MDLSEVRATKGLQWRGGIYTGHSVGVGYQGGWGGEDIGMWGGGGNWAGTTKYPYPPSPSSKEVHSTYLWESSTAFCEKTTLVFEHNVCW